MDYTPKPTDGLAHKGSAASRERRSSETALRRRGGGAEARRETRVGFMNALAGTCCHANTSSSEKYCAFLRCRFMLAIMRRARRLTLRGYLVRQQGAILPPRGARKTYSVKYRTATSRKQVFKGGFATKTKASEYLKGMVEKIDRGVYVERTPITFEKFSEQWHWRARRKIRGSTESGSMDRIIRAQLVPRVGAVRLSDLRLEHVQQAVSFGMIEDELSVKTIHNAATLLLYDAGRRHQCQCTAARLDRSGSNTWSRTSAAGDERSFTTVSRSGLETD